MTPVIGYPKSSPNGMLRKDFGLRIGLDRNGHSGFNGCFAVKLAEREIIRAERLFDAHDQGDHILANGAGKQVDGAIIVFGPCMQTGMRLCEKQKTGKAVRAKLVKALIYNRQAAFVYGLRKQRVSPLAIHEDLMVAVGEIKDEMLSQFQSRVHSHLQVLKR